MQFTIRNMVWEDLGNGSYLVTGDIDYPENMNVQWQSSEYDAQNETEVITYQAVEEEGNPSGTFHIDINVDVPSSAKKGDTEVKGLNGRVIDRDSVILE